MAWINTPVWIPEEGEYVTIRRGSVVQCDSKRGFGHECERLEVPGLVFRIERVEDSYRRDMPEMIFLASGEIELRDMFEHDEVEFYAGDDAEERYEKSILIFKEKLHRFDERTIQMTQDREEAELRRLLDKRGIPEGYGK